MASSQRIPPQPVLPLRDDLLLTYYEAAAYLRATERQVRRWIDDGRLGCRRLNQRKTLIEGRHVVNHARKWARSSDPFDPQALVFTTPTAYPVRQSNFYKRVFIPAARRALPHRAPSRPGASPLRFHDLRHTAASLALSVTPNLGLLKQRLGHEDIRTTINMYGHMVPDVDAALADALGALFDQQDSHNVVRLPQKEA